MIVRVADEKTLLRKIAIFLLIPSDTMQQSSDI